MKLFKRGIVTLAMVGVMCMAVPQNVEACDKTPDCYAKSTYGTCGHVRGVTVGHRWTAPNGEEETCGVEIVSGPHTIRCRGCNAVLGEEQRKCYEIHSNEKCPYPDKIDLCKY